MNKKTHDTDVEEFDPDKVRDKILHILKIYPIISPTMLQGGLGPAMRPIQWRPILQALVAEGLVMETQKSLRTPLDRYNTYTMLHLPETKIDLNGV